MPSNCTSHTDNTSGPLLETTVKLQFTQDGMFCFICEQILSDFAPRPSLKSAYSPFYLRTDAVRLASRPVRARLNLDEIFQTHIPKSSPAPQQMCEGLAMATLLVNADLAIGVCFSLLGSTNPLLPSSGGRGHCASENDYVIDFGLLWGTMNPK